MAQGDRNLLAAAFDDRLHEPYRPSPLLDAIRAELPPGAVGATLSGSGPTVIVWADDSGVCVAELEARFPDETVLALAVAAEGAH
jgi:homoserine kinase